MTEQSVESGATPEHVATLGEAEIDGLVDFWCGRCNHFTPTVEAGLDYISKLKLAAQSPFLGDIFNPHDLNPFIDDATEILAQIPVTRCKEYNQWLQSHPGEVVVLIDGTAHEVTKVAVSGYDIFPVINGEVIMTKLDATWLNSKEEKRSA